MMTDSSSTLAFRRPASALLMALGRVHVVPEVRRRNRPRRAARVCPEDGWLFISGRHAGER